MGTRLVALVLALAPTALGGWGAARALRPVGAPCRACVAVRGTAVAVAGDQVALRTPRGHLVVTRVGPRARTDLAHLRRHLAEHAPTILWVAPDGRGGWVVEYAD